MISLTMTPVFPNLLSFMTGLLSMVPKTFWCHDERAGSLSGACLICSVPQFSGIEKNLDKCAGIDQSLRMTYAKTSIQFTTLTGVP